MERLKQRIVEWEARRAEIARLHGIGLTRKQIAQTLGISRQRVYQVLEEMGLWEPKRRA